MGDRFTQQQAQALMGLRVRTQVEFSGVPAGTAGKVVRADEGAGGYTVGIQWELAGRDRPLVDWFDRAEFTRYLESGSPDFL